MDKLFGDRPPADARAGAERPICGRSTDANDGGCRAPQLAGHEPYGRVSRPAVSRYSAFNDRYSTSTFTFRDGMSCHGLAAQTLTVHLLFPDTTMASSNAWRCSSTYTVQVIDQFVQNARGTDAPILINPDMWLVERRQHQICAIH